MSKTKTKKAPSKSKPAKAPRKPAAKSKTVVEAPAEAAVQSGVCPKGGDHKWKTEDGKRFCEKCFEPGDDATPAADARAAAAPTGKKPRTKKTSEPKADGKLSAIDAAAKVLGETAQPMNCQELIKAMSEKGYWTSPGGQTPHATLYSAILREITTKGTDARFQKTERGKFALRGAK
jgi:hypothetical protein